jgi:hypothetical protein
MGTYSSVAGSTSRLTCKRCPAGTYQSMLGASSKNSCLLCVKGKYSTGTGQTTKNKCRNCAGGKYQSAYGSKQCRRCAVGTFAPGAEMTACHRCNPGTFKSYIGSKYNCSTCLGSTYQSAYGASSCGHSRSPSNLLVGSAAATARATLNGLGATARAPAPRSTTLAEGRSCFGVGPTRKPVPKGHALRSGLLVSSSRARTPCARRRGGTAGWTLSPGTTPPTA